MWLQNRIKWRYIVLIFCGILLIANTLSLFNEPTRVKMSDLLSGVIVSLLSFLSLYQPQKTIDWILASIGAYLMLAPDLLWEKSLAAYLNDTLIGALIFTFAILFSPEELEEVSRGGVPLDWRYNPSSYGQRIPVIALAFLAYLFSRYMAFYQLGYIPTIWDPIFGDGTHSVITSKISQDFPVSDAGLGSWVYAIEALMGIHGSSKRWHTIPWFVIFFAILVIPAGLVSVLLITLQPLIIGAYCFWCLITALCMLFMIALASDEVAATLLFLSSVQRRGGNVRQAFWHGDLSYETGEEASQKLLFGLSFSWNLIVSSLIGFWMMFLQPHIFNPLEAIIGALVITFSIISFGEVLRGLRWINVLLGLLFALLAIHSDYMAYHIILGIAIILLAIPKGAIRYSYGKWNQFIV